VREQVQVEESLKEEEAWEEMASKKKRHGRKWLARRRGIGGNG
jgi:hypothetical protein